MVIRRATNICASLVIVAFSVLAGAGGASSAVPSPIDPAMLPEDGPPAPPQPTEQRTLCVPAVAGGDGADIPRSQRDLGFDSVWPITRGAGQRIAVIDTGVSRHPRLPSLDGGGDYVGTSDGTDDCDAHGTVVAGLIAAQQVEGSGFSGAAPDAQIISIRQSSAAFSVAGQREDPAVAENSSGYGNVDTMASAVRHAADMGASVINISEVACKPAGDGISDQRLGAAIEYATIAKNVVVVAAAGNVGSGGCKNQNPPPDPVDPLADPWKSVVTIASPAWYDDYVLTVGSVDPNGAASSFSLGRSMGRRGGARHRNHLTSPNGARSDQRGLRFRRRRAVVQRDQFRCALRGGNRRTGQVGSPGTDCTSGHATYRSHRPRSGAGLESLHRSRRHRSTRRGHGRIGPRRTRQGQLSVGTDRSPTHATGPRQPISRRGTRRRRNRRYSRLTGAVGVDAHSSSNSSATSRTTGRQSLNYQARSVHRSGRR